MKLTTALNKSLAVPSVLETLSIWIRTVTVSLTNGTRCIWEERAGMAHRLSAEFILREVGRVSHCLLWEQRVSGATPSRTIPTSGYMATENIRKWYATDGRRQQKRRLRIPASPQQMGSTTSGTQTSGCTRPIVSI